MSLLQFGYAVPTTSTTGSVTTLVTTPPADGDFKTFFLDPYDMPVWIPYGTENRAGDNEIMYTSLPAFSIIFNAIPHKINPLDGTTTGTFVEWFSEWRTSQNTTNGFMWVCRWSPKLDDFEKILCKPQYVNWSDKIQGHVVTQIQFDFKGVGLTDYNYAGGVYNPPDPATDGIDVYGDAKAGGFGWGVYGGGGYGQGGY